MNIGKIKPDFFAWKDDKDVRVLLSSIGRNDQNSLEIRNLSTLANAEAITHGVNEIAHIAVDPANQNVYWTQV